MTGSIKIICKSRSELLKIIEDKVSIFNQRFLVEEFIAKPKVIICAKCQKFGHIHSLCRSDTPKCGKCSLTDHETKDCTVNHENYKCSHCDLNHQTGSKNCDIFKLKEDEINNRRNHHG